VPYPVVSGFMSGIGCIIIVLQVAPLIGQSHSGAGVVASLAALPGDVAATNWQAALIAAVTLGIIYLTPGRLQRLVPSPLIALASGTIASAEASMVSAAKSSGSSECTSVLPQARAIIWHSRVRVWRKL